jgi:hypothetical protein
MKNAHQRFGALQFTKRMKDTTTDIRLRLDRFIGEPATDGVSMDGRWRTSPSIQGLQSETPNFRFVDITRSDFCFPEI